MNNLTLQRAKELISEMRLTVKDTNGKFYVYRKGAKLFAYQYDTLEEALTGIVKKYDPKYLNNIVEYNQ